MAAHVVGSFEHFAAAGNGAGELLLGRSWARGEAGNYWGRWLGPIACQGKTGMELKAVVRLGVGLL